MGCFARMMSGEELRAPLTSLLFFICLAVKLTRAEPIVASHQEPEFAEPIVNHTVPVGRKVTMSCVVDHLNNYRVAWMFMEKFTLLTLAKSVITHNSRFRVTHNGHRTWQLHIHDVQERDRGAYMCQINTSPMKSQVGYLNVVVPPKIDESQTSDSTEVAEGGDVALRCIARGTPEPEITWRREDDDAIALSPTTKVPSVKGTWLNITKVSRLHMSAYLCIASNGVLPAVSKRIVLEVSFAPMIWMPNQLVGASLEADVALDCNLESHPRSVTYWTRGADHVIHQNAKYSAVTMQQAMYKVQMQLVIHWLRAEDYGEYHCMAKNTLGETQGTIKLYETSTSASATFDSKLASQGLRGTLHDEQQRSIHNWPSSAIGNRAGYCSITSATLLFALLVGALSSLATATS